VLLNTFAWWSDDAGAKADAFLGRWLRPARVTAGRDCDR
jgi:hypothetical protein